MTVVQSKHVISVVGFIAEHLNSVEMHIDRNTLSHSTYSTRFIAADEELTISCKRSICQRKVLRDLTVHRDIQPIQTRADRQHLL